MFNPFEELFAPGRKHTTDEQNRLALTREDVGDADPGRGPIDLESGRVVVRPTPPDEPTTAEQAAAEPTTPEPTTAGPDTAEPTTAPDAPAPDAPDPGEETTGDTTGKDNRRQP
ncbi:DUF6191 domain-containing protein [Streptomyces sp. NPDC004610]|uniref:DUF6191 domain-containing protein n=1 Tax=unclassified Streptomyces TaxID=2593676 RepID=UPI0033BCC857